MTTEVAEVEQQEDVREPVLDSDNQILEYGDLVRVSDELAVARWHSSDDEGLVYEVKRDFDFGSIEGLNDDGTVEVAWYSAGCSCDGTRTENPADLTKATENEYSMYYRGLDKGKEAGKKDTQLRLRSLLGLTEPADEDDN